VPSTWLIEDVVYIAGQKCQKYVDNPEFVQNAQVVTADVFGTTQWLVNVLSYDKYLNVKEAVQIQDFLQGQIEDPTAFGIPPFCQNARECSSIDQHVQDSPAQLLPVYLKRRFGWEN
jgi:hypothetical protein